MNDEWFLSGAGTATFFCIALAVWFACIVIFIAHIGDAGFVIGHVVGLVLIPIEGAILSKVWRRDAGRGT